MTNGLVLSAAIVVLSGLAFISIATGKASAQYPPPEGSLQCVTQLKIQVNQQAKVSARLLDLAGAPVAGEVVTFHIVGQSAGATLSEFNVVTDANGTAVVQLWAEEPGVIEVSATHGSLACNAISQVSNRVFTPPSTGNAGLLSRGSTSKETPLLSSALLVAAGLTLLALWEPRRNPQEQ